MYNMYMYMCMYMHMYMHMCMYMSHVPPPTTQEHHKAYTRDAPALCTYPCTSLVTTFSVVTLKATHHPVHT